MEILYYRRNASKRKLTLFSNKWCMITTFYVAEHPPTCFRSILARALEVTFLARHIVRIQPLLRPVSKKQSFTIKKLLNQPK